MHKWSYLILIISTLGYSVSPFYVVGENYVAYSEPGRELLITRDVFPGSWTLDSEHCRLWVSSKVDSKLLAFEQGKFWGQTHFSGKIVSEVVDRQFATATENNVLELRDLSGQVKSQVPIDNSIYLQRVQLLTEGESWNLFERKSGQKRSSLWFTKTDGNGKELKKVGLESSQDLWGKTVFSVDKINQRIWVGYTRSTPQHMYSPYIIQFSFEGEREFEYQWEDRGVLFDGCLESNGDFLVSRDIPSSEFTVPLYSYLENLPWGAVPSTRLELNTNLLVDSMDCRTDSVYLAVHSVLGGEPHQILFWDRSPKSLAEPLVTVPPKIQEVLTCD